MKKQKNKRQKTKQGLKEKDKPETIDSKPETGDKCSNCGDYTDCIMQAPNGSLVCESCLESMENNENNENNEDNEDYYSDERFR